MREDGETSAHSEVDLLARPRILNFLYARMILAKHVLRYFVCVYVVLFFIYCSFSFPCINVLMMFFLFSFLDLIRSEMATVGELVQMMNTLQGQHHALNQKISSVTAENPQFKQAGSPRLAEIATTVVQALFRLRFPMRTHDQRNDKVWSASMALGNPQRP